MRLPLRRTLAAAALVPMLASGLAACGDDSGGDDTASDPTSQVALSSDLSEGDEVEPAEFVQTVTDGVENSTTAHMTMTMDLGSSGSLTAEGDVDYTSTPPAMAMTMTMPEGAGGTMDIRMVDGVMYLSMGELTQGKFWKMDPSDPNGPLASMGMDKLMDQMDPAKALELMKDGISKVTYVGAEDGLDHYEMTVDVAKMMDSMGAQLPGGAQAQVPDSVSYDLWLDDQNRFSKMEMDLPIGGTTSSTEMNVSDWGADVSIEAPPADQVTDMPDMGSMLPSAPAA